MIHPFCNCLSAVANFVFARRAKSKPNNNILFKSWDGKIKVWTVASRRWSIGARSPHIKQPHPSLPPLPILQKILKNCSVTFKIQYVQLYRWAWSLDSLLVGLSGTNPTEYCKAILEINVNRMKEHQQLPPRNTSNSRDPTIKSDKEQLAFLLNRNNHFGYSWERKIAIRCKIKEHVAARHKICVVYWRWRGRKDGRTSILIETLWFFV